jgi:uncharacterized membrane protein YhaH (DUF805 family)
VSLTLLTCLAFVFYLKAPLRAILVELCGTRERADFWAALSHAALVLVPLIFAMQYIPEAGPGTVAVVQLATQLKWALIGLAAAVAVIALVLSRFIPRQRAAAVPHIREKILA